MDANLLGGEHPDFSDDNQHLLSEGMFFHGFLFAPRAGTIWSYLYDPADLAAADPMASSDWLRGFGDSGCVCGVVIENCGNAR